MPPVARPPEAANAARVIGYDNSTPRRDWHSADVRFLNAQWLFSDVVVDVTLWQDLVTRNSYVSSHVYRHGRLLARWPWRARGQTARLEFDRGLPIGVDLNVIEGDGLRPADVEACPMCTAQTSSCAAAGPGLAESEPGNAG